MVNNMIPIIVLVILIIAGVTTIIILRKISMNNDIKKRIEDSKRQANKKEMGFKVSKKSILGQVFSIGNAIVKKRKQNQNKRKKSKK